MKTPHRATFIAVAALSLGLTESVPALANPTAPPTTPPPVVAPLPDYQPVEWPLEPIVQAPDDINNGPEAMVFSSSTLDGNSTEIDDGKQYILKADVMFAYNKAKLTTKAKVLLSAAATKITAANPARLVIMGHTDSDGDSGYNLKLSQLRANAVRAYLASKLPTSVAIQAIGKGETKPRSSNATKAGRALNRRVDIIIPS